VGSEEGGGCARKGRGNPARFIAGVQSIDLRRRRSRDDAPAKQVHFVSPYLRSRHQFYGCLPHTPPQRPSQPRLSYCLLRHLFVSFTTAPALFLQDCRFENPDSFFEADLQRRSTNCQFSICNCNAPVAQMDRATASGAVGRAFESRQAHKQITIFFTSLQPYTNAQTQEENLEARDQRG
jgi:hypothetical protein